jgi:phage-related protein
MSSDGSIDIRAVIFINRDAETQYRSLPDEVRQSADARTSAIQDRQRLPSKARESLKGKLAGIDEIKIGFDGDTYRVYYAVEFEEVIYILDAGMKKSPRRGQIPKQQVDRLVARLKAAREDYQENRAQYQADQRKRLERRKAGMPRNAGPPS